VIQRSIDFDSNMKLTPDAVKDYDRIFDSNRTVEEKALSIAYRFPFLIEERWQEITIDTGEFEGLSRKSRNRLAKVKKLVFEDNRNIVLARELYVSSKKVSGWYNGSDRIHLSEMYDKNLRFKFREGELYQSGDKTIVYYPGSTERMERVKDSKVCGLKKMVKVKNINIRVDKDHFSTNNLITEKSMLELVDHVSGQMYVYTAVNHTVVKAEVNRLKLKGFFGNGLKKYQYSRPSNSKFAIAPAEILGDAFSTKISISNFTVPEIDPTSRFSRSTRYLGDDVDYSDYGKYDIVKDLDPRSVAFIQTRYEVSDN